MNKQSRSQAIHFYLPCFAGGGAERVFIRLANHFADLGLPVVFVVNFAGGPLAGLLSNKVDLIDLGAPRERYAIPKLVSYLRRTRPPVLLSGILHNNIVAGLSTMLSRAPTRLVLSERNDVSSAFAGKSGPGRAALKAATIMAYRRADALTAVSAGVASDLAQVIGRPANAIHVIENPSPEEREIGAAREAPVPHPWFEQDVPVIIAIGRLHPQKNYPLLLGALQQARQTSGRDIRLIVLGDGDEAQELSALAARLGLSGSVAFTGFVLNRLDFLVRASLFVLSSDWEGFPNVLIEAMACGVPVISTDADGGGPRQVLAEALPEALVPRGDQDALATAIMRTLEAPPQAERLTEVARRFSMPEIARRYLKVLEQEPHGQPDHTG
ncbi:glycosyltransferase [Afifella sp. IM 167]|uniref:glycosyltransferase n=1 Tax=Afifella sp. IM 167 TaxID=2033586 RepID=UPI0027144DE6|nr:glycosyltransferase [Afifella sp. IM 167]MBZ8133275.1 glycosyl transferase [Afifella sp. IM 167]